MTANPNDKKNLKIDIHKGEVPDRVFARLFTKPEVQAALTVMEWQEKEWPEDIDVNARIAELEQQTSELKAGSMHRAEEMLLSQAQTLDELFNNLARRARRCEHLNLFEANLKLALKAQNQARMTLETLSNIKNPPVVYAKQANIAHGPQQINNGLHAENQNQPNELLTVNHGQTLDSSRTSQAIGSHQAMATLEK